jgi:hypothetical protein
MYAFVKFLHVAAAIVWVGGGTWSYILMRRLKAAQAGPALAALQPQMKWLGLAVIMPASILALFTGLYLVLAGPYPPESWWIAVGLAGLFVSIGMGMAVITPAAGKLGAVMAEHGPGHPDAAKLQKRMGIATTFNLVVLWVVVYAMVIGATG